VVREKVSDVRQTGGAKQSIADGVGETVGIRVTVEAVIDLESYST
jgi:hypothetical protein